MATNDEQSTSSGFSVPGSSRAVKGSGRSKQRMGMRAAVRAAVVAYGAAAALPAMGLGLGEIEMQSFLNEPLQAQVELLDTRELTVDDIRIRLAGNDDFDRMGVDRSFFLTSIEFEVVVDEASGRGFIRLSSEGAVLEPYLDVIIEARWPSGRLLREYTVLVDPPAFKQDMITVSASERVEAEFPDKPARADGDQGSSGADGTATSTTDGVAIRPSNLPPGEMPSRAFSAETSLEPSAGSRYMIRRDETLWQIAAKGKPEGISVQQAMLDIQRVNPEAFIAGNINRIKAGYIIYLPAEGEVDSTDLSEALSEVREQNQQWRSGQAPGVTAAATLRVSADPVESQQSVATGASGGGVMRDDTLDAMVDDSMATADGGAQMPDEVAPAGATVASPELAAQLQRMGDRLDTLEQIVALKDEQIATLEQALREAREAAAAPAPAAPAAVAPAPAPAPRPAPAPTAAGGGIPWLPIGGGVAIVGLGLLAFLRRRSKDEPEVELPVSKKEDAFAGVKLNKNALDEASETPEVPSAPVAAAPAEEPEEVIEDEAPAADEKGLDRGGSRGYGERKHDDYIDEGAAGDALAEADIYIAYGRYLQAVELLDTAIENEPNNDAYRVKLIELYVDMGEEDNAKAQLEALRETGSDASIARGEALLGGAGGSAAPVDDVLTRETPAPEPEMALALDDTEEELELDLDDLPGAANEPEEIVFEDLEIEDDTLNAAGDTELDFTTAEEEIDLTDALVDLPTSDDDVDGLDDLDGDDDGDLLIADDADQMATKLDLARAYIDMGDSEGARVILKEVLDKGGDDLKKEASELMDRIV